MTDPTGQEARSASENGVSPTPPASEARPQPQSRGSSTGSSVNHGGGRIDRPAAPTRPRLKKKDTMNGPLYMQTSTSQNVVLVRRLKRKDEGTFRLLAQLFVENQIGRDALFFFFFRCHYWELAASWGSCNSGWNRGGVSTLPTGMDLPNTRHMAARRFATRFTFVGLGVRCWHSGEVGCGLGQSFISNWWLTMVWVNRSVVQPHIAPIPRPRLHSESAADDGQILQPVVL